MLSKPTSRIIRMVALGFLASSMLANCAFAEAQSEQVVLSMPEHIHAPGAAAQGFSAVDAEKINETQEKYVFEVRMDSMNKTAIYFRR
jgi:hypothetical protein